MQSDPHLTTVFSYYRDAEMRGATLLLRLCSMVGPGDMQTALSRHICDETRHAWLWTKRIMDLGGVVVPPDDGYQRRIGREGLPRSIFDIFALTVVVEQRAFTRYQEHLSRPDVDPETRRVLQEVSKDETWHIGWIESSAKEMAKEQGRAELYDEAITRYRAIDVKVTEDLKQHERNLFGFCYADPFKEEDLAIAERAREGLRRGEEAIARPAAPTAAVEAARQAVQAAMTL